MNKAARDLGDIVGKHVPAGRIGNAEDMAGVAIYLAARSGNYVVGDVITVDGGVVHAFLTESWEIDPAGGH
jgi:NAD(P)-dependent dehydrogenase (short-subunit alcohol dehydrogenase family)